MITKPKYWHDWRVVRVLRDMLNTIERETDPKTWHLFIGKLCIDFGIYRQKIDEWEDEYKDNTEIVDTIKRIRSIFEARINEGALRGQLNFVQSIFNLKNNYGWKDEQHIADARADAVKEELHEIRNRLATRRKNNMKKQ